MRHIILASIGALGLMTVAGTALADPASGGTAAAPATATTTTTTSTPSTATTTASAAASDDANLDEIVCKTGDAPTGSRLGATRECHTKRQWNDMETQQRNELSRIQTSSPGLPGN